MQPAFIDGPAGPLFTLYHPPAGDRDRGDLIFVPPFAEELNRSRHMMARAARTLAAAGWGVLLLDLYGTGDSGGEFSQARWPLWQDDIMAARAWIESRGRPTPGLWAMRTGALLAAPLLSGHDWRAVLFWQPVPQGKTFLTQFLRVALAAGFTGSGDSANAATLRDRLKDGESLEIAGYEVHPELAAALEEAALTPPATCAAPIVWLEVANSAPALTPGQARASAAWRDAGLSVAAEAVSGPQFWMLQEPEWAPALIERSRDMLAEAV